MEKNSSNYYHNMRLLLLFLLPFLLNAMTLQEWREYKKTDDYKKERQKIQERKSLSNSTTTSNKKTFKYSYDIKQPKIASKRFYFYINKVKSSIPYESNYSLNKRNKNIKHLIVAIHSSNHDAKMYIKNTQNLTKKLSKDKETLIIAPHLLITSLIKEKLLADFTYWEVPPFRGSSRAINNNKKVSISAYEILDKMINKVIHSNSFPNLKSIVIFGHSAGGQLVNRYAAYNQIDKRKVDIKYIVMAPSSYVYFNKERAVKGTRNKFQIPKVDPKYYNYWGFGMQKLYSVHRRNRVTPQMMQEQYKNSHVIYLVGSRDNNPNDSSLGKSKGSMWQGRNRVERARIYHNYLQHIFGRGITRKHELYIVPNVGHSSKGLMNSKIGKKSLF